VCHKTGCWLWVAGKHPSGYGLSTIDGKTTGAHRVSYTHYVGEVPNGLELDHLCRVRHCVNPEHLEAVTHAENMKRGSRATMTHCGRGHEFTEENTYVAKGTGARNCRKCTRARANARRRERYHSDHEYRENENRLSREAYRYRKLRIESSTANEQ